MIVSMAALITSPYSNSMVYLFNDKRIKINLKLKVNLYRPSI